MQQITRDTSWPQSNSPVRLLKVSPFQLIVLMILAGFIIVNISARALAQYSPSSPNPFATFADVFPGQPRSAALAQGFSCSIRIYDSTYSSEHCILKLAVGPVSEVRAVISQGIVYQTQFVMRENIFRLGDLILLFGRPELQHNVHSGNFLWPRIGIVASGIAAHGSQVSLFRSLRTVSFTDIELSPS